MFYVPETTVTRICATNTYPVQRGEPGGEVGTQGASGLSKRAAVYCRVSSQEQSDGISLTMQEQRCTDWISSHAWELADTYSDIETGRHAERPQLKRLRQRLSQYDALVAWRLDRVTRSLSDLCELLADCRKARVSFVSVTEGFDVSQPFGVAIASILGALAQLESANIGQRVQAGKAALVAHGHVPWKPLYGYRRLPTGARATTRQNGRVVVDEAEAQVIREIFTARSKSEPYADIAERLNGAGHLRRGEEWTRTKLSAVVHQRSYIGFYERGKTVHAGDEIVRVPRAEWVVVPGLLPPIVSREEWHMAHGEAYKGRRPTVAALYRRLLHCVCGARFYVHSRRRRGGDGYIVDYRCAARQRGGDCRAVQLTEADLIAAFARALRRAERNGTLWVEPPTADEAEAAVEEATATVARAQEAYVRGLLPLDALEKTTEELRRAEAEANHLSVRLAEEGTTRQAVEALREALAEYEAGHVAEANEALRALLARIELDSSRRRLRIVLRAVVEGATDG